LYGTLKIKKIVDGAIPATDWVYTSDIPGNPTFTLPAAGGDTTFLDLGPGTYTVTEQNKDIPGTNPVRQYTASNTCGTGLVASITLGTCASDSCTFTNTCRASITIQKIFTGDPVLDLPANDWSFTSDIPGHASFTLPKAGGSVTFTDIPVGTYHVTEGTQESPRCPDLHQNYAVSNSCQATPNDTLTATIPVTTCADDTCIFRNRAPNCQPNICQWCSKSAVLSQVWQNPGGGDNTKSCLVPDILVDVRMPHGGANNVVDASEIGTGVPATWSIQAAVDYANAHRNDPDPNPFKINEIFIGVTASDPVAGDPTTCGLTCSRPPSGDNPFGTENVVVNNLSTVRMNIFGCSVSMKAANVNLPVFTVTQGVGKVTILDLHVKSDAIVAGVQGYLVTAGNAGRVTLKNARAIGFDIGYEVRDNDVEITGSPEISHNRIGIWINGGTAVTLRTNNMIVDNSQYGIRVDGSTNELNGQDVGVAGHPNVLGGILVNGSTNNIHDCDVYGNTGDGINVTGNTNMIKQNDVGEKLMGNTGDGIHVNGYGNTLDGNDVYANGGDGIDVSGGTALQVM
jgi:hypothetical protein